MNEPIKVWCSAYELYTCSLAAPEVTGTPAYVVALGTATEQDNSRIPAPRCKTLGYTTAEWCGHWHQSVPDTVPKVSGRVIMRELLHEMHQRIFGRDVCGSVRTEKIPAPAATDDGGMGKK